MAILYAVSFMIGYWAYNRIAGSSSCTIPFFAELPIYTSLGLLILIPVTFVASLFAITSLTVWGVFITSIVIFVNKFKKRKLKELVFRLNPRDEVLPFLLFLFTTAYFIYTIGEKLWPPPGDIMSGSGPLVSLIEYNGRLPFSPNPFLLLYPPGFHIIIATFNCIWGLYPAQAIFIFGGSVAILIPLVVYALTYLLTRSRSLSLMAFSCTFISDPVNLERWIMGYFYNGAYPSMTGFLMLLTFASILATLQLSLHKNAGGRLKRFFVIGVLSSGSLFVTYPPFAIPIVISLIVGALFSRKAIYGKLSTWFKSIKNSHVRSFSLLIGLMAVALTLYACIYSKRDELNILFGYLTATYTTGKNAMSLNVTSGSYRISTSYLFGHVTGILFLIGLLTSFGIFLAKRRGFGIETLYLIMGIPVLLSLNADVFQYVAIILPNRTLVLLSLFSWVLIFSTIGLLLQKAKKVRSARVKVRIVAKLRRSSRKSITFTSVGIAMTFASLLLFSYMVYPYVTGEMNKKWFWFDIAENDFAALEWINKNVPTNDLVLNDATFTSEFEMSMSVKNMTYWVWGWLNFHERANALLEVWREPSNLSRVLTLLQQHNVSYILSTSEWGQLLYNPDLSYSYVSKPYTPEQYAMIFDQYPFLKPVFRQGSTIICKVDYQTS